MVNRRFQVNDEFMLKYCMLSAPPEARIKLQMTNSEVRKTKKKKNANQRIHVYRAINRIKSYKISKPILPVTVLHNCNEIICTCTRLCY